MKDTASKRIVDTIIIFIKLKKILWTEGAFAFVPAFIPPSLRLI